MAAQPPVAHDIATVSVAAPTHPHALHHGGDAGGDASGRFIEYEVLVATETHSARRAYDTVLRREVVLERWVFERTESEGARGLVERVRAWARVDHANVAATYDVVSRETELVRIGESIRGPSLGEYLADDRSSRERWRRVLRLYLQAGRALAAAHARGATHGAFRPESVVVGPDERVVVTIDLGQPAIVASPAEATGEDQRGYCQALWTALAGGTSNAPGGSTPARSPWSLGMRMPARLVAVVRRGLEADPTRRWPSLPALVAELEAIQTRRRRRGIAGTVVTAGALVTVQLWTVGRERAQRCGGAEHELAGVWDDTRKARVRGALLATERPYARDTWQRIATRLDRRAGVAGRCQRQHRRGARCRGQCPSRASPKTPRRRRLPSGSRRIRPPPRPGHAAPRALRRGRTRAPAGARTFGGGRDRGADRRSADRARFGLRR